MWVSLTQKSRLTSPCLSPSLNPRHGHAVLLLQALSKVLGQPGDKERRAAIWEPWGDGTRTQRAEGSSWLRDVSLGLGYPELGLEGCRSSPWPVQGGRAAPKVPVGHGCPPGPAAHQAGCYPPRRAHEPP